MNNKVQIKHLKFINQYGRNIAHGTVYTHDGEAILYGQISVLVKYIRDNDLELENAQELFYTYVDLGYGV